MKQAINRAFLYLIPLLVLGVYLGYTTFIVCLMVLFLRIITTNKVNAGIFLIMFGGLLGGLTRALYPFVPIYGLLLVLIGVGCISKYIKALITKQQISLLYIFLIIFIIDFAYIYGPQTPYATSKMLGVFQNGFLFLFAYYTLNKSTKIDSEALGQLLIITALAALTFTVQFYNFSGPTSLFDYDWYRSSCELYQYNNKEGMLSGYQDVGMNVLFSLSFILSNKNVKVKNIVFYSIIGTQLIMTSGARQAIFGLIIVLIFKVLFYSDINLKKKIWSIALTSLFIFIYFSILSNSGITSIANVLNSNASNMQDASGRGLQYIAAYKCIEEHTIFGAGLGGYEQYGAGFWPHNFILEILCENGIVGLFLVTFVVLAFYIKFRTSYKHLTINNLYFFLITIALLCRIMVSSDFTESIGLFSAIFAVPYIKKKM